MIVPWTIGYTRIGGPDQLLGACGYHDLLVDCRSKPVSRVPHWHRRALADLFGSRYLWRGQTLGGLGAGVQPAGLQWVAEQALQDVSLILLCACELPGDCHRHRQIALPLLRQYGLDCLHVCGDELIPASELQAAMETGTEYTCLDLGTIMRDVKRGRWPEWT